jgi:hypothetical protein
MLESVTRDKEDCMERYEVMLHNERADAEERETNMRREFTEKLGELEEQYNELREHVNRESGGADELGPENEVLLEGRNMRELIDKFAEIMG